MKPKIYFLMYDKCIVHGGFFDTFEYYYLVKKVFKNCEVKWRCITSHPKSDVIAILEDKYEDIEPKVYRDIEVIRHRERTFFREPLMIDVLICPTTKLLNSVMLLSRISMISALISFFFLFLWILIGILLVTSHEYAVFPDIEHVLFSTGLTSPISCSSVILAKYDPVALFSLKYLFIISLAVNGP